VGTSFLFIVPTSRIRYPSLTIIIRFHGPDGGYSVAFQRPIMFLMFGQMPRISRVLRGILFCFSLIFSEKSILPMLHRERFVGRNLCSNRAQVGTQKNYSGNLHSTSNLVWDRSMFFHFWQSSASLTPPALPVDVSTEGWVLVSFESWKIVLCGLNIQSAA
jgi:hypothetical protein